MRALFGPGPTDAEGSAGATAKAALIRAFRPSDVIGVTLAGQAVLFNELLVASLHDARNGATAATQQRGCTNVLKMSRLLSRVMNQLEQCGNRSYWTDPAVQAEANAALAAWLARPKTPKRRTRTPVSQRTEDVAAPDHAGAGGGIPAGDPMVETFWLDAPYEQWSIAILDDLLNVRVPDKACGGELGGAARVAEPALPRRPAGYAPVRIGVDAANDD